MKRNTWHWIRVYLHIYYNQERAAKEHDRLMNKIIRFESGLVNGSVKTDSAEAKSTFLFRKIKKAAITSTGKKM